MGLYDIMPLQVSSHPDDYAAVSLYCKSTPPPEHYLLYRNRPPSSGQVMDRMAEDIGWKM
jgi:hypothetical protein